jgi:predicted permease
VTTAVIGASGLAIAITTALFSIVDGLLFRPLPFPNPSELVAIDVPSSDGRPSEVTFLREFSEQRAALRMTLENSPLIAETTQVGFASFFLTDDASAEGIVTSGVDSRFFSVFGLYPMLGRTLDASDEVHPAARDRLSDAALPVVISHDLWRRLSGADPRILGVRKLAGRNVEVVGVMRPGVKFPGETNVWAPVGRNRDRVPAYARLADGVTPEQIAATIQSLSFKPLENVSRVEDAKMPVAIFIAGALLALVTWTQLGAMLFALSVSRLREVGVQLALGASRLRIWRRTLVENSVLAAAGFILGWIVAQPLNASIVGFLPSELRDGQYLAPDARTFGFACALLLVGIFVLSAVPWIILRRSGPHWLMAGPSCVHQQPLGLRRALLFVQLTLTTILLYASGLAIHSYVRATGYEYGFDSKNVVLFKPPAWAPLNATPEQLRRAFSERNQKLGQAVAQLDGALGVDSVSTFFAAPLGLGITEGPSKRVQVTHFNGQFRRDLAVRMNSVGPQFVRTLGSRMVAGYSFDDPQHSGQMDVAVINLTLARRLMPFTAGGEDQITGAILGREIRTEMFKGRVVGVINDLVDTRPGVPADPQIFTCDLKGSAASLLAIRVNDPLVANSIIQARLRTIWPDLRPGSITLLSSELEKVLAPYRAQTLMLTLIAALAVPIAAIGLTGALAYSVRAQSRELAVRLMLGAAPADLRRTLVRRALLDAVAALAVGVLLGIGFGRLIAQQLLGVQPADAPTTLAVTFTLLALCWVATLLPARVISRLEPAMLLRES